MELSSFDFRCLTSKKHRIKKRPCSRHNPPLLGSWRHWFTFVSRAPTHRAASGDFVGEVLSVSRGTRVASASLPTRHIEYTTERRKSQLFVLDVKHLKTYVKRKPVHRAVARGLGLLLGGVFCRLFLAVAEFSSLPTPCEFSIVVSQGTIYAGFPPVEAVTRCAFSG